MVILALNAFHGDASAAVLRDGQLIAALEEERLNRMKHWAGLPLNAARVCLGEEHPDHIAISRDPRANLHRKLLRTAMTPASWRFALSRGKNLKQITSLPAIAAALNGTGSGAKTHFV